MKGKIHKSAVAFLLTVVLWSWCWTRPRVYKTATSPDGTWSVTVLLKRSMPPPLEGVDVVVRVNDGKGRFLLERAIDNRDRWQGVEVRYPDVVCEDGEIRVGPRWWDGKKFDYWRLKKADL